MNLRRLAPGEADLHREVRLRALRDAPDAFGEFYADVAERPMSYWQALTRAVTGREPNVMLLACAGETVIGATYGLVDRDERDCGRIGGMWVEPEWRRQGVGTALLDEVFSWSREQGFSRLRLWAPPHRPAALALYHHAGFREIGHRRSLPTDPARQIIEMEATL